jgi:ferredoxin
MFMAGASAVQVCTASILRGPGVYAKIVRELEEFLDSHGYADVADIKGLAHRRMTERLFRTAADLPMVDQRRCNLCGVCETSCVYKAISSSGKLVIDEGKCFGCGLCVTRCPKKALALSRR